MSIHINTNIFLAIFILFIFAILFIYLEKIIEIENKLLKTIICFCSSIFMTAFTTVLFSYVQFNFEEIDKTTEETKDVVNADTSSNNKYIEAETTHSIPNETITYIEDLYILDSDRYIGNEGDSFIYKIGLHKFSRGNQDIYGNQYEHGLEIWIARWNYTNEISWVYSILETNNEYSSLEGRIVLINSYNTDNFDTTLHFYDGDRLLEKYILTPNTIPLDIKVDIKNVNELKIYAKDNLSVSGGTSFGLVNCILK